MEKDHFIFTELAKNLQSWPGTSTLCPATYNPFEHFNPLMPGGNKKVTHI